MLSIEGHLTIWEVDQEGNRRLLSDKENQITNLHLTNLAELVTQEAGILPAELATHSMWIEASVTALPAASASDTGAAGAVVKQAVFTDADIDVDLGGTPGLCEFRAVLETIDANGTTIRAAGLYTRGDDDDPSLAVGTRLLARQVFDGVPKSSAISIEFRWRIQYKIVS